MRLRPLPGETHPQTRLRQRQGPPLFQSIAAKHAAHGIGEQGDDLIPEGADVAAALHALGDLLLGAEDPVDGDVPVRHLGGEFLLEAVDVDENAVELLLVGLDLLEAGFTLRLPRR